MTERTEEPATERAARDEYTDTAHVDVLELIPHAPPIVVIDRMVRWAPGRARCVAELREGRTFVKSGRLDVLTTIEHMGQGIAACLGYEAFRGGDGVRVGMIIASKTMTLHADSVEATGELVIDVDRVRGNETLSHFKCSVTQAASILSEALLTVIHAEEPPGD